MNKASVYYFAVLILYLCIYSPHTLSHDLPKWLSPFVATYNANANGLPFKGSAIKTLTITPDGNLLMKSNAKAPFNKIEEESLFSWKNCNSQPIYYRYKRKTLTKKKHYSHQYNWLTKNVTYQHSDKVKNIPIHTTSLTDRVSEQLVVRCKVRKGLRSFNITTLHKDTIKKNKYHVIMEETVTTPLDTFHTLKVEKKHLNKDRTTHFWLAKDLDYAIVKIIQKDEKNTYTISLKEYSSTASALDPNHNL